MPTYDYICQKCGAEFERFQSISAKAIRKCPNCGKNALKRLIGAGSGIIFKGQGFYETDYRSDDYKKAQKSEKENNDKGAKDKKKQTKAESKTKVPKDGDKPKKESTNKKKSA